MADGTISWAEATWNPITGCAVLAGTRLKHHPSREGLTIDTPKGPVWSGEVRFNEAWLDQPLRWRRPRMIFVCAHGDLFAENVPDDWIDRVFAVMALAPQHTFQVLTKRAARMRDYLTGHAAGGRHIWEAGQGIEMPRGQSKPQPGWPLPNCWLGVSVEDQARAGERIPHLLATPAALRWVSAEPLLGPVRLHNLYPITDDEDGVFVEGVHGCTPRLDWVVAGGESQGSDRPMHPAWVRSLRDQCQAAGVPFHFKQWGDHVPDCGPVPRMSVLRHVWPDSRSCAFADLGKPGFELTVGDGHCVMISVGAKAAGRTLDGRIWGEFPRTVLIGDG